MNVDIDLEPIAKKIDETIKKINNLEVKTEIRGTKEVTEKKQNNNHVKLMQNVIDKLKKINEILRDKIQNTKGNEEQSKTQQKIENVRQQLQEPLFFSYLQELYKNNSEFQKILDEDIPVLNKLLKTKLIVTKVYDKIDWLLTPFKKIKNSKFFTSTSAVSFIPTIVALILLILIILSKVVGYFFKNLRFSMHVILPLYDSFKTVFLLFLLLYCIFSYFTHNINNDNTDNNILTLFIKTFIFSLDNIVKLFGFMFVLIFISLYLKFLNNYKTDQKLPVYVSFIPTLIVYICAFLSFLPALFYTLFPGKSSVNSREDDVEKLVSKSLQNDNRSKKLFVIFLIYIVWNNIYKSLDYTMYKVYSFWAKVLFGYNNDDDYDYENEIENSVSNESNKWYDYVIYAFNIVLLTGIAIISIFIQIFPATVIPLYMKVDKNKTILDVIFNFIRILFSNLFNLELPDELKKYETPKQATTPSEEQTPGPSKAQV